MTYKGENLKTKKQTHGSTGKEQSDRPVEIGEREEPREKAGRRQVEMGTVLVGEFHALSKG